MDAGSTIDLIQESEYPDKLSTQDHIFVTRASESWVGPREKKCLPFPPVASAATTTCTEPGCCCSSGLWGPAGAPLGLGSIQHAREVGQLSSFSPSGRRRAGASCPPTWPGATSGGSGNYRGERREGG